MKINVKCWTTVTVYTTAQLASAAAAWKDVETVQCDSILHLEVWCNWLTFTQNFTAFLNYVWHSTNIKSNEDQHALMQNLTVKK